MAGAFPDSFTQDEINSLLKHDPAQAKQLMAAAGYANGVDLQFNYPGNSFGQIYITQMQLLQSQLNRFGINLQLNSLDKDDIRRGRSNTTSRSRTQRRAFGRRRLLSVRVFHPVEQDYTGVNDPELTPLLQEQRPDRRGQAARPLRQAGMRINAEMSGRWACTRAWYGRSGSRDCRTTRRTSV